MESLAPIGINTVAQLVGAQFPDYADLPLEEVKSAGTDNAMFRLGRELVVRLPKAEAAITSIRKEAEWLPAFASMLPIEIPEPIGLGRASDLFDAPWSIYRWIEGEDAYARSQASSKIAAQRLGLTIRALRDVDTTDAPHSFRAGPLSDRSGGVEEALAGLDDRGLFDLQTGQRFWETALEIPAWDQAEVWIHADLWPSNLLVRNGELAALIDFGGCGLGDPACDLMAAWTVFDKSSREMYIEASGADSDTVRRGRAWAFSFGVGAWEYHELTNPVLADVGRRTAFAALADREI